MAEEKTFRYGLIVLGFFLVMVGMFIMSVDKPQVYITFCTLGVLAIAAGIIWSMCQCYPKVGPIFSYVLPPFASLAQGSMASLTFFPHTSSHTPYTSQEEANVYEKSLPSYEQIQMNAKDSVEGLGVQTVPLLGDSALKTGGGTRPFVQAKAEVHRISENDGETPARDPSGRPCRAAPLASFQEDVDLPSSDGSTSSGQNPPPSQGHSEKHSSEQPRYEDFALMDSLPVERWGLSQEPTLTLSQTHLSATASPRHFALATGRGSKGADCREIQSVEEADDMYYGLKEGPENLLVAEDFVFQPDT
uniref:Barttin CLCNK type accessory subunit beta n=1 Tax=Pelusios castaneus TaxID=367368 RepID=A0A8C8SVE4_9SAUR